MAGKMGILNSWFQMPAIMDALQVSATMVKEQVAAMVEAPVQDPVMVQTILGQQLIPAEVLPWASIYDYPGGIPPGGTQYGPDNPPPGGALIVGAGIGAAVAADAMVYDVPQVQYTISPQIFLDVAPPPDPTLVEVSIPVRLDTGEIAQVISPVTHGEGGSMTIQLPAGAVPTGDAPQPGISYSYAGGPGSYQLQKAMTGNAGKVVLVLAGGSFAVWAFSKLEKGKK
jgi:hypothetical protein